MNIFGWIVLIMFGVLLVVFVVGLVINLVESEDVEEVVFVLNELVFLLVVFVEI